MLAQPTSRWFDPLVHPVRDRLEAAWRWLPAHASAGGTPGSAPRAGLGGAVVIHVARGWGTRRWQEIGRVAVALVEAANRQVYRGEPDALTRASWWSADLHRAHGVVRGVARRDEALLRRVALRALGGPDLGAGPVPEAVLFLRGAVAAGVLAGAVPDATHAALDRWALALGRAMERAEAGEPTGDDLAEALAALADLPECDAKDRLVGILAPGPVALGAPRAVAGWAPFTLPSSALPDGPLERALLGPFPGADLPGAGPLPAAAAWL
ncbi:MAG: hypothetical protein Q8P41_09560, partial [Pseudomonadota bacterium]|nr:hypothetical protein [Pseudomonadota bacterium]